VNRRTFARSTVAGALGAALGLDARLRSVTASPAARGESSAAKSIRIERIESFKVVVPMRPGTVLSENYERIPEIRASWDFDSIPKYILRLHASNGLIGLGETGRGEMDAALASNSAFLKGRDILNLDFADPVMGLPQAATSEGFEIAVYDLLGKTLGVPVHTLLGGRFQDKIAVTYWTGQRNEADLAAIARKAVELGFKHLKFKAQKYDPVVQMARAVDKAAPDLEMGVDFNSSYPDLSSFLPVAKRLEGFRLSYEDPIPRRMDWFRELRQRVTIPLALTLESLADVWLAIQQEACDIFNLGFTMRDFVKAAFLAEAAGIPVWHGSGVELGLRDISFIHAAAATRSCTFPSDTLCFLRQSDLLATPFKVVDGFLEVPRGPGLGVELDEDAVKHYQVR
jgi:muconate cycloisomerase